MQFARAVRHRIERHDDEEHGSEMPLKIGPRLDHGFDKPLELLSDCHRCIEYFLEVLVAITDQVYGGPLTASHRSQLDGALAYCATVAWRDAIRLTKKRAFSPVCAPWTTLRETTHSICSGRLEHDHADADQHHAAVDRLVRQWLTNGWLTASEVDRLRDHLVALQTMYQQHIAIEDRELLPTAGRLLSAEELRDIGREMAAQRLASASTSTHDRRSH
jgi:hypothetical protein